MPKKESVSKSLNPPKQKKSKKAEGGLPLPKGYDEGLKTANEKTKMKEIDFLDGKYIGTCLHTGSVALDLINGGGFPFGKCVYIRGFEQCGKSTSIIHLMKSVFEMPYQEEWKHAIPIHHYDHESSQDPKYYEGIGLNIHDPRFRAIYKYWNPDTGDGTFRHMAQTLRKLPDWDGVTPNIAMFVDSLASMLPEAREDNPDSGQRGMGANMLSEGFPQVKTKLARKGGILVYTNQVRMKPGVAFGDPEYSPGGNAPMHNSDIRLRFRAMSNPYGKGMVSDESTPVDGLAKYRFVKVKVEKNKMFPAVEECWLKIRYSKGIDPVFDAIQYLELTGQARKVKKSKGDVGWAAFEVNIEGTSKIVPPGTHLSTADIRQHADRIRKYARHQMKNNSAFDLFFTRLTRDAVGLHEHVDEDGVVTTGKKR